MTNLGLTNVAVLRPVEIQIDFESLDSAADRLKLSSQSVADHIHSAGVAWQNLRDAYHQPDTENIVWSAMDRVPEVMAERAGVFRGVSGVLASFAAEGLILQRRARDLEVEASELEFQVSAADFTDSNAEGAEEEAAALNSRVREHNQRVTEVNSAWQQLEVRAADDVDALSSGGGRADEIPEVGSAGVGVVLSAGGGVRGQTGVLSVANLAQSLVLSAGSSSELSNNVEQAKELYSDITEGDAGPEDMTNFYDHMAKMSPQELRDFRDENPTIDLRDLPQPSTEEEYAEWPDGQDGLDWWNGLDVDQQDAMMASFPLLVGNTRGVPTEKRHEANHNLINNLLRHPHYDERSNPEQRQRLLQMKEQAPPPDEEEGVDEDLNYVDGTSGDRYLLSVIQGNTGASNPHSMPTAQISIGDPETADDVGYNVHGMNGGSFQESGIEQELDLAQQDHDARSTGEGSYASVAWMYDPPVEEANWENLGERISDWLDPDYEFQGTEQPLVHEDVAADEAGWRLAMDLDGMQQAAEEGQGTAPNVHMTAHSFGTNTLVHALTRTDNSVQTVHLMGSSGIPRDVAPDSSALNVDLTEDGRPAVAATESENDSVAQWGRDIMPNRINPFLDEEWGAYQYSSDSSNIDIVDGVQVDGHGRQNAEGSGYLNERSYAYQHRTLIYEIGFDSFNWEHSIKNDPQIEDN